MYDNFVGKIASSFDHALSNIHAEHNFDLGSEFEIAICKTLRTVLPHRFGICRGFVVNSAGETAGDDIIIYERLRFPTVRMLGEDFSRKEQIPIEAAFAYLEAKHTLVLEGDGDASLQHSVAQAARVKTLCSQRAPVPLSQIASGVNLRTGFNFSPQQGWPSIRNPFYSAVVARQVRLTRKGPVATNPVDISAALGNTRIQTDHPPDLIVAGRSHLALPVVRVGENEDTITAPFASGADAILAWQPAPEIAFGVALAHLIWALDYIYPGNMPWNRVIADALGLRTRQQSMGQ